MLGAVTSVSSIVIVWSLWTRRYTWRCRWELASTVNVIFMGTAILLMTPPLGQPISEILRETTGIANLRFHIASVLLLLGVCAIVRSAVAKLTVEHLFASWFHRRIEIPVGVALILLTLLFITRPDAHTYNPNFMMSHVTNRHLALYWMLYSVITSYVLFHGIRAMIDLWFDKPSRPLVYPYLIASVTTVGAMVVRFATALVWTWQTPTMVNIGTAMAGVSICLFTGGAAMCWIKRVGSFTGKPPWMNQGRQTHRASTKIV